MTRKLLRLTFATLLFILGGVSLSFAQDEDRVQWSATKRLTLADFRMVVPMAPSQYSYISLVTKYFVHGYDAFGGNLNKKVSNYMIPSASYIDTSVYAATSLMYEQTIFDLHEIYARKMRRALKQNRKKLFGSLDYIDQQHDVFAKEMAQARIKYDRETNFARNIDKQKEWEAQIKKELDAINEYSLE